MNKILVVRLDFIGDLVVTTAFIDALHEKYPNAEIHTLTNYYNRQVLESNPAVYKNHTYIYVKRISRNPLKKFWVSFSQAIQLFFELRKQKFDLIVIPNSRMDRRAIRYVKFLNAKKLLFRNKKTYFNEDNPVHVSNKPLYHEAFAGFKLLPSLTEPAIEELKFFVYPQSSFIKKWENEYPKTDRKRIGLFVSQKSKGRALSQFKWLEIASIHSDNYEIFVYSNDSRDFDNNWPMSNSFIFPITPTIQDLIASMTLLDYVICTDSAPLHFCSALSIPVVGLFENRIEKLTRWHPVNTQYELVYNKQHVDSIEVKQIIDAFSRLKKQVNKT